MGRGGGGGGGEEEGEVEGVGKETVQHTHKAKVPQRVMPTSAIPLL